FGGKRLAVSPHRSIFKMLFFPDGHSFLQRVDEPSAGVKRGSAMRGCDRNQDTALPHFKLSQPMHEQHIAYGETFSGLLRQGAHLLQRHFFIGFIKQVQRPPSARVVAHDSVEDHDGPVFSAFQLSYERLSLNRLTHQRHMGCEAAAAYRRQQGNLITVLEKMLRPGILAVHGDSHRIPELVFLWSTSAEMVEQHSNGRARRHLQRRNTLRKYVFQNAKEQNAHMHTY